MYENGEITFKKSGSQGGDICFFFAWRNRTKSHHSMCSSVASTCFYIYTKTLLLTTSYLFSILIDETPYFVGIVDDMDSIFVRESSIGSVLNIFYPLTLEVGDI